MVYEKSLKMLQRQETMASGGLMTYSQFKSSRQNSMNGSSAKERPGAANQPTEEGEFEQVGNLVLWLVVVVVVVGNLLVVVDHFGIPFKWTSMISK